MINFQVGDTIAKDIFEQVTFISPLFSHRVNVLNSQITVKANRRTLNLQAMHVGTLLPGTIEVIGMAVCSLLEHKYPELSLVKLTVIQEANAARASVVFKITGPIAIKAFFNKGEIENVLSTAINE